MKPLKLTVKEWPLLAHKIRTPGVRKAAKKRYNRRVRQRNREKCRKEKENV